MFEEIYAQMTGNKEHDIETLFQFLTSQRREETFDEAARLVSDYLNYLSQPARPKTKDPAILKAEKKKGFDTFLYILKTYIDKHFFVEALDFAVHGEIRIKQEIRRVRKEKNNNYLVFRFCFSPMEYALTDRFFSSPNDEILDLDYVSLLVLQGQVHFYLQDFEEAKTFFRKAMEYDPVAPELSFFIADIDGHTNNWFSYLMDLDKIYCYCYRQDDLKRYYRYLSLYYKEYQKNMTLYNLLTTLGDTKKGQLFTQFQQLTEEEKALLEQEKIPYDISEEVLQTLIFECRKALDKNDIPMYKYFYSILKTYRNDNQINELIQINKKENSD